MLTPNKIAALAGSLALAVSFASPAAAQGYGHGHGHGYHKPHVCKAKVTVPAEYAVVWKKRVVKEGYWETKVTPAEYASRPKQVLVKEAQTIWHTKPAVYKEVVRHRVVGCEKPEGYGHHKGHGHGHGYGHHGYCKPKYASYKENVLVEPAKKYSEYIPAEYKTVYEKVVVAPEKKFNIWHAPVVEDYRERVLVREGYETTKEYYSHNGKC